MVPARVQAWIALAQWPGLDSRRRGIGVWCADCCELIVQEGLALNHEISHRMGLRKQGPDYHEIRLSATSSSISNFYGDEQAFNTEIARIGYLDTLTFGPL